MSEWQPIETYDELESGMNVLLWNIDSECCEIPICTGDKPHTFLNAAIPFNASHWIPLPEAPVKKHFCESKSKALVCYTNPIGNLFLKKRCWLNVPDRFEELESVNFCPICGESE